MRNYLAAVLTGMLLLGSSPALFAGTPRTMEEKRMQTDYNKRKAETKAYRANLKKQQESLKAQRAAEKKGKSKGFFH